MAAKTFALQSWDDIVFQDRNKSYGAYLLRKAYSKRVMLAVGLVSATIAAILVVTGLATEAVKNVVRPEIPVGVTLDPPPSFDRKRPEPKQVAKRVETQNTNTTVQVVETPVEPISQTVQDEPSFGSENGSEGGTESFVAEPGTGTGIVEAPPVNRVVNIAEVMPTYRGGMEAMLKFIKKKITYPAAAKKLGQEGTVFVSFVVNGDGRVTDVTVLRGFHPKCDEEAVRVVSLLNDWIGGSQGGVPVSVRMVLPIKFALNN